MRIINYLLFAQLFILSSCSFYPVYTSKQVFAIKKGMPMEEVTYIMGRPCYRSFDGNAEEWSFVGQMKHSYNSIIQVRFSNGKVVSMTSFEKPYYTFPKTNENKSVTFNGSISTNESNCSINDFDRFYESVRPWAGSNTCIEEIEKELPKIKITSWEALKLVNLFTFSDDKMKVAKITYPRVSDPSNFDIVIDSFSFMSDKDELKEFIKK